jgi:hypothetical protein
MVDADEVREHVKKFKGVFGETERTVKASAYRPSSISITGAMHSVLDFMKALEKNSIDTSKDTVEIKAFYSENKSQTLDGLVLDYITKLDSNNERVGG